MRACQQRAAPDRAEPPKPKGRARLKRVAQTEALCCGGAEEPNRQGTEKDGWVGFMIGAVMGGGGVGRGRDRGRGANRHTAQYVRSA